MVQQWWQWFIFPSLISYLPHGQPWSCIPCLPGVLLIHPGENNRYGETLTIKQPQCASGPGCSTTQEVQAPEGQKFVGLIMPTWDRCTPVWKNWTGRITIFWAALVLREHLSWLHLIPVTHRIGLHFLAVLAELFIYISRRLKYKLVYIVTQASLWNFEGHISV
jgi:hypothetical protein